MRNAIIIPLLRYGIMVILTAAAAIGSAYADSRNALNSQDAQCVIVGVRIAAMPHQQQRTSGQLLALYFLGRIEGRSPDIGLKELIKQQAGAITAKDVKQILQRCGKQFASEGAELTRIGSTLATP